MKKGKVILVFVVLIIIFLLQQGVWENVVQFFMQKEISEQIGVK